MKSDLLDNSVIDNENNYLPLDDIYIGFSTRNLLNKKVNDSEVSLATRNKFLNAVISFYRISLRYTLLKMNVDSTFWEMAQWIDFGSRHDAKWSHVEYFVQKYEGILQYDTQEMDKLYEEFVDYKTLTDSEMPAAAWEDAVIREYEDGTSEYRIDTLWYYIQSLRSLAGNNKRFDLFFNVARLIMITPHSNAGIERVFSLVNKNKSAGSNRNRLDIEGSLSSILAVKMERPDTQEKCYSFKPSDELLKSAKQATYNYNKSKGK